MTKSAVSIRPYDRLYDIWGMVARSAFAQLKYSWLILVGTVIGLIILFVIPAAGMCTFMCGTVSRATILFASLSFFIMAFTYVPTLRFFGLGAWMAFTLPVAGALYLAMTVSSAMNYLSGQREWRGARGKAVRHDGKRYV